MSMKPIPPMAEDGLMSLVQMIEGEVASRLVSQIAGIRAEVAQLKAEQAALKAEIAELREEGVNPPYLLNVKRAAAYIDCSEQALQHMISKRQIDVVRDGRRVFLRRVDLKDYCDQRIERA